MSLQHPQWTRQSSLSTPGAVTKLPGTVDSRAAWNREQLTRPERKRPSKAAHKLCLCHSGVQAAWSALGTCSEGQGSCRSPSPDAGPARRWVTQEFEMRPHDGLQTFQLNPGVLCVGGHLQVCTVARPAHRTPDCVPRSWQISACSTGHASCLKASAAVLHDQSPKA